MRGKVIVALMALMLWSGSAVASGADKGFCQLLSTTYQGTYCDDDCVNGHYCPPDPCTSCG